MADFAGEVSSEGSGPEVRQLPPWDWVEAPEFVRPRAPRQDEVESGRCFWLSDCQINLASAERVWFSRTVVEVMDHDGLQYAGQIDLDFDPSYQRLVLHHVRVIRDGMAREIDPMPGLSVFRRERDLERARYDGHLTAHYVIPDIRVGDIIDVAHSSLGASPILRGHFSAEWSLSWACWVGETRIRVLSPPNRRLVWQSWQGAPDPVEVALLDGLVEQVWRTTETKPVLHEPDVPPWAPRFATVKACTPIRWDEVADAFRGFYDMSPLPEDLEAELAIIEEEEPDAARRAARLLRQVQSGLRYQAVSIGEGGFVPRPLDRIWATRAGDCKDASRLLVAMLRRLSLDAAPALVNTRRGWTLNEELPSLTAFDHCIVRLRLAGREYWLDPTVYPQGGRLDVLHQARFGWALPLTPASELSFMGDEPVRDVSEVDEQFDLGPEPASPATLTVRTTFRAWRADDVRRSLASEPGALSRSYVEYYSRIFGEVRELEPLHVEDDLEANELRLIERYSLSRPWAKGAGESEVEFAPVDQLFASHLTTAPQGPRRWPIDLGLPRRASWTCTVNLPMSVNVQTWDRTYEMPGIKATSKHDQLDLGGREIRLAQTVVVERPFLPPEEADAYFDLRESALRSSGVTVTSVLRNGHFEDGPPPPEKPWGPFWRAVGITILIMLAFRLLAALVG